MKYVTDLFLHIFAVGSSDVFLVNCSLDENELSYSISSIAFSLKSILAGIRIVMPACFVVPFE